MTMRWLKKRRRSNRVASTPYNQSRFLETDGTVSAWTDAEQTTSQEQESIPAFLDFETPVQARRERGCLIVALFVLGYGLSVLNVKGLLVLILLGEVYKLFVEFDIKFETLASSPGAVQIHPSPKHLIKIATTQRMDVVEQLSEEIQPLVPNDLSVYTGAWKLASRNRATFEEFLKFQGEPLIRRKAAANAPLTKWMTFNENIFSSTVVIGGWFEIKETLKVGDDFVSDIVDGRLTRSRCFVDADGSFVVHKISAERAIEVLFRHIVLDNAENPSRCVLQIHLLARSLQGGNEVATCEVFERQ